VEHDLDIGTRVLVRGLNDVASATAHRLFGQGYAVALQHEHEPPKTHRRRMGFADAFFDGFVALDGVVARRCATPAEMAGELRARTSIPVVVGDLPNWLEASRCTVLIDARMRKRIPPECHCGMAALTIGLGPGHVAPRTADVVIETFWDDRLGAVLREGSALPLAGEPRPIDGIGRERIVYAPVAGVLRSDLEIGDPVSAGAVVATIEGTPLHAPISGTLRGLTRPGISVLHGDKVLEVDPRPPERAGFSGLGERPQRIAEGVALAIRQWLETAHAA
jgi:xanthine dehydrogenase accessory factor